jgi:putative Mn2+ efflux pump MntP
LQWTPVSSTLPGTHTSEKGRIVDFWQFVLIAVGLAMDAFAVSIGAGVALYEVTGRHTLRVALWFGTFQGIMPVVGWLAGHSLKGYVEPWSSWLGFALLMGVGVKMILDSLALGEEEKEEMERKQLGATRLLLLSFATSIDALAMGVTIAMLHGDIVEAAIIIGVITGALSAAGMEMGDHLVGVRFGRWSEVVGGALLCGIAISMIVRWAV